MDLVLQSDIDGTVSIWTMDGLAKTIETDVAPTPGIDWVVKGCGDFDGDGCSDIIFQNGTDISMWLMDGTTPRTLHDGDPGFANQDPNTLLISVGTGTFAAIIDHDGASSDVVVMTEGFAAVSVWAMDASGKTGETLFDILGANWNATGAGDFGVGSGILCRHLTHGTVAIIENTQAYLAGPNPGVNHCKIGAVGDFDGDAKADIAWQVTIDNQVFLMVWFIRNGTYYSEYIGDPQSASMKLILAADMDGDGKSDLVWDDLGNVIVWTMSGTSSPVITNLGGHT